MKEMISHRILCVLSSLVLVFFLSHAASFAQEKTDTKKLYAEIAGDYEFEFEGQVTVITFFVKDGVLKQLTLVGDCDGPLGIQANRHGRMP